MFGVWSMGVTNESGQKEAIILLLCVPRSQQWITKKNFPPSSSLRKTPDMCLCIYDSRGLLFHMAVRSKKFFPSKKRMKPVKTFTVLFEKFPKTNLA